ncbi:hypothetical protein ACJX0J_033286, partial [Zea mays]
LTCAISAIIMEEQGNLDEDGIYRKQISHENCLLKGDMEGELKEIRILAPSNMFQNEGNIWSALEIFIGKKDFIKRIAIGRKKLMEGELKEIRIARIFLKKIRPNPLGLKCDTIT